MRKLTYLGLATAIAALPAVAVAKPAAPTPVVQAKTTPDLEKPDPEALRATLRTELLASGGGMMRWAMDEYAAEFRSFEDALIADLIAERLTVPQAQQRTFDFITKLRARGQAYLLTAPDKQLAGFMREQLDLLRYFSTVNVNACYEMGEDGGLSLPTLTSLGDAAVARMKIYADKQVMTVVAGQKTPVARRQPLSQQQLGGIVDQFVDKGGDMAWLQALNSKDFSRLTATGRCENAIILFDTVLAQPDDVAVRFLFGQ